MWKRKISYIHWRKGEKNECLLWATFKRLRRRKKARPWTKPILWSYFSLCVYGKRRYSHLSADALAGQRHQISRCWSGEPPVVCALENELRTEGTLNRPAISPAPSTSLVKGGILTTREKSGMEMQEGRSTKRIKGVKLTFTETFQWNPKTMRDKAFEKDKVEL